MSSPLLTISNDFGFSGLFFSSSFCHFLLHFCLTTHKTTSFPFTKTITMMPLVNLFPTSSGEEEDRWRIKTEEKQGKKTEEESEPLISLALGIGGSTKSDEREKDNIFGRIVMVKEENKEVDDHNQAVVEREGCRINSVVRFTEDQVQELKRQLLIFKYLVCGLPLPFHLLPPHFYLYKRSSPPFLFFCGTFDHHRQMIDPEPGRCRRTDGKKWRCHQSVISNEKYCEKHMHRGSNRSRKLVEACPYSRTTNLKNLNKNINLNKDIRPRFSENLGPKEPTKVVKRAQDLGTSTAVSYGNKQSNEAKCVVAKDRIAVINQTSGLDFSPKSVLLIDTGIRCPSVQSCKSNTESESRCKRTDGKKWQCKKEVLPYQKYCAQHVNRGRFSSKKRSIGSSSSREIQAAYGSTSSPKIYGTGQATVGLGLKISLPTRLDDPRNIIKGSMSQNGGSSSSTEATESDESTDVSDIIVLSP